jgi:hypothetical protein
VFIDPLRLLAPAGDGAPSRSAHRRAREARRAHRRQRRVGCVVAGLVLAWLVALAVVPQQSWAQWVAHAAGTGTVDAEALPEGDIPFAVVTGRDVSVTWDQAVLTSGNPVQGYQLRRYPSTSTTPATMASTCTGMITALSCVETNVPPGIWRYTITPLQAGWTGLESAFGSAVTVGDPALTFTSSTTIPAATLPVALSGTLANFLSNEPITFRLDSPSGTVLSGSPATAGVGGNGTISVTIPAGTNDSPHSVFVVGSGGSVASAAITVVDAPALSTLQMFDVDKNGKVDQVVATFSETLATPYTAGTFGWTLANAPSGATLSSVSVAGNAATLTLAEGPGAADTAVGTFTVALAATSGGVRDANGHRSSFSATAPTDKAAPAPVSSPTMQDSTANGKVDRVAITWSEPIAAYSAGNTPWTLANVPSAGTLTSVTAATGSTATTLNLTEGAGAVNTAVGSFTVALASSGTGIRDAAGNLTSFAARSPLDGARPVRVSQRGLDANANGKFDRVDVVFSEALSTGYSPSTVPWTFTGAPTGTGLASVGIAGSTASLNLNEGTTFTTAVGSWTIALAASATGVIDPSGNQASYAAIAVTDAAAPALVTQVMQDAAGNDGIVDRVTVTFSETLTTYSAGNTPWTLANVPSGSTLTSATRSGATMVLALGTPTGPADTAVGSFTVGLATNAAGVRDAAGNLSSYTARAPSDGARPVPISLSGNGGTILGRIQPGDTLSVLLSETLGASVTLPASTTVTMTDPSTTASDNLTIAALFNGARSTGSNNYISTNNVSADFASSPITLSGDRKTITVTVGPTCTNTGCAGVATNATAAAVSVLLNTTLLDAAGNAPTTTARNITFRLF